MQYKTCYLGLKNTIIQHINSVEQLTHSLINIELRNFPQVIRKAQLSLKELNTSATWKPNDYTRNCLTRNERFEIILLCWDIGAKTPIHDHGGKDCWVYQVKGCIEEVRYIRTRDQLIESNRIKIQPSGLTYMNDKMGFHSIQNTSDQRAMSLHIYASPIDSCRVFNKETALFEKKDMSYNSYNG